MKIPDEFRQVSADDPSVLHGGGIIGKPGEATPVDDNHVVGASLQVRCDESTLLMLDPPNADTPTPSNCRGVGGMKSTVKTGYKNVRRAFEK